MKTLKKLSIMKKMKKSMLTYAMIAVASLWIFSGCDSTDTAETTIATSSTTLVDNNDQIIDQSNTQSLLTDVPLEELSDDELEDILFMREEEKLARDVYLIMYDKWGIITFQNISRSEQAHMDAVLELIHRYGLSDPAATTDIGEFVNEDLQQLYNDLIEMGSVSDIEALKVGALIEEVDIEDLRRILDTDVDNRDIALVYGNLLRGSGHHLKAYTWNLKRRGVNYTPQVLSQEAFDEIINS